MKKSKIILVASLSLVLCLLCASTTTFSWFTRPQSKTGNSLEWSASYDASDGSGISMVTYESEDDGATFNENPVTSFSNTSGIAKGQRKYYRTDITNKGNYDQSVSLYLSNLSFSAPVQGNFYLGVNSPLKTYKNYTPGTILGDVSYEKTNKGTMRVYFQPQNKWTETNLVVNIGSSEIVLTSCGTDEYGNATYYADIPATVSDIYFAVQGHTENYQRTQTQNLKSLTPALTQTQSLVFWLPGGTDTTYGNMNVSYSGEITGGNIVNYYRTITLPKGKTFSAALAKGSEYIGSTITYSSGNAGVFTVVGSSGLITAQKEGTATLTTKVKGSYGDEIEVKTDVIVTDNNQTNAYSVSDVPIVTNLKVAAGAGTEDGTTTESVYWYIKNDSNTSGLKYTISDVYLTL